MAAGAVCRAPHSYGYGRCDTWSDTIRYNYCYYRLHVFEHLPDSEGIEKKRKKKKKKAADRYRWMQCESIERPEQAAEKQQAMDGKRLVDQV